ncbi:MAG TPA: MgtC/SapB family protein [Verrucomicrobiae bacterium]|jgi:putative Mg2+ transporter-C (MgtC) family protein|nr:MgtC/SapB family protein [Verrucomicrobiae bacterium]
MLPLSTIVARLAWAALLGAIIGIERNVRRRPSGMRTGFCVSLGAALFTIVSVEIARRTGDASTTRIASNIVQGIGFLGAGVILRERGNVVGLTTAATIFAVAAMGMAAGGGLYAVSGISCGLVLFALVFLYYLEDWLNLKPRYMLFRISVDRTENMVTDVHQIFSELKIAIDNFQVSLSGEKNLIQFDAEVSPHQQEKILKALCKPGMNCEMVPVERQNG